MWSTGTDLGEETPPGGGIRSSATEKGGIPEREAARPFFYRKGRDEGSGGPVGARRGEVAEGRGGSFASEGGGGGGGGFRRGGGGRGEGDIEEPERGLHASGGR